MTTYETTKSTISIPVEAHLALRGYLYLKHESMRVDIDCNDVSEIAHVCVYTARARDIVNAFVDGWKVARYGD